MTEPPTTPYPSGPVPAEIPFAKGHGTGNDFVVLPDLAGTLPLTAERVRALCDRRRGIGGDGVLRVVRTTAHPDGHRYTDDAAYFMDYWNADGSLAEMCGNGVRVFARYLLDSGLAEPGTLRVATRAGVRIVDAPRSGDITIDVGAPIVGETAKAVVSGDPVAGTAVVVGNPHLVCFVTAEELPALDLLDPPDVDPTAFPDGVNVEFAVPQGPDHVRIRIHERGVGETASCGTGACAVAAVVLRDAGRAGGRVTVDVPGGRLTVTIETAADGTTTCRLAGPAVLVANGTLTTGWS